jgi:hypothetical protein
MQHPTANNSGRPADSGLANLMHQNASRCPVMGKAIAYTLQVIILNI